MRDIKFRLFGKNSEEFLGVAPYGLSLKELQNVCDLDAWHIMQFTGLTDKNGVEVFEGDVIEYGTPPIHQSSIFWSPQDFGFITDNKMLNQYTGLSFFTGYKNFEVIGNIHSNPELLEQNDE